MYKKVLLFSLVVIFFMATEALFVGAEQLEQSTFSNNSGDDVGIQTYPVGAWINPTSQTITGSSATARWTIAWDGGDGRYVVRFTYGDGGQ
ncbi:hypothetical protein CathTA2_0964 [Caldalkalibacillus thermarum TA2.A1]|uniref:Uncharacterized protein n=1 Tax=Caldalkalibacillus thermarum (strain TA2.A1) TaxID=986075 RepID=F5L5A1_CALTT|nr:hypothetical protein [Caldalkalibacillus thermarum]EGL83469.1 hypothetical protein CathTA2_0964 [Caldalkalibacillus thermarum TA2.A1]QZT34623.1 hypothetical protein HUR95_04575 [Caldalkalibacillus thermarum TA2.A1]